METLDSAILRVIENQAVQQYTAIPCVVVAVQDARQGIVDVKPLINIIYDNGETRERPPILGVPLMMPATSTSIINLPVQIGDTVLCVFSMRGLDVFKAGDGSPAAPADYRIFDKRDAIAIPGLFPFSEHPNQSVADYDPTALSITHNVGLPTEAVVKITETGEIEANSNIGASLSVGAASVTITPVGVDITGILTINGAPYLAHTHSGVTTGPGVSGPVV